MQPGSWRVGPWTSCIAFRTSSRFPGPACRRAKMNTSTGASMTRYVIEPEVALALAQREASVPPRHRLLAPTLLRSQVLAQLFVEVRSGGLGRKEASRRLDY